MVYLSVQLKTLRESAAQGVPKDAPAYIDSAPKSHTLTLGKFTTYATAHEPLETTITFEQGTLYSAPARYI